MFFGLFSNNKKPSKTGLCVLYLNCSGVQDTEEYIRKYKARLYEDQGLNTFLNENSHHFVILPVNDQTRMEFIWF